MANVHDVAAYILAQKGSMSTWKLQKLVYYSQAWHLVWDEEPLFDAPIEAWANGPVVRKLYAKHRGAFSVDRWPAGDPDRLEENERDTIDLVVAGYGDLSGRQLSVLTHSELPWNQARKGLAATDRSTRRISPHSMQAFYTEVEQDESALALEEVDWEDLSQS